MGILKVVILISLIFVGFSELGDRDKLFNPIVEDDNSYITSEFISLSNGNIGYFYVTNTG